MELKKCLTIEEVASRTNTSIKFVRREVLSKNLKSFKSHNRYYINEDDFNSWKEIERQTSFDFEKIPSAKEDEVNWADISKEMKEIDAWKNPSNLTEYNFIDLFTGAGGLSCGLTMAGFKPVGSVEILDSAIKTYRRNFSENHHFGEVVESRDIREESVKLDLIEKVKGKHIHLIAGGFPCQGFSMAGNRIVDDERNSLYREMLNIVSRIKPDFVLMENVEGLRSMLGGEVEKKIISDYKEIGYEINVTVLNAADYGVPQTRRRVIFIGNRIGKKNYHPCPIYSPNEYRTVKDGIEKFLNLDEDKSINHEFTRHTKEMIKRLEILEQGKSLYANYSDAWKRVFWDKPSPTVKENHGGVNVHPLLPRVMTARELASLQSFPDDFIFEGTKKWQLVQIGNAVPPLLGKAIGLTIRKNLEGGIENE